MLDTIKKTLDTAVEHDPASGVHRASRDIFTDPEIVELGSDEFADPPVPPHRG